MYNSLLIIYFLVIVCLVIAIMLQRGEDCHWGSIDSNITNVLFKSNGSGNFLTKLTSILAAIFFVLSLIINNLNNKYYQQDILSSERNNKYTKIDK